MEIFVPFGKVECILDTSGFDSKPIIVFDRKKVEKVIGIVEKEETISEAERLIKEANSRTVD